MFGFDWSVGCLGCSMLVDEVDGGVVYFVYNGVMLVFVLCALLEMTQAYKVRMGWGILWVLAFGSDFNADYGVSFSSEQFVSGADYNFCHMRLLNDELLGLLVFVLDDDGVVFYTYSMYVRGMEVVDNIYVLFDRMSIGCDE